MNGPDTSFGAVTDVKITGSTTFNPQQWSNAAYLLRVRGGDDHFMRVGDAGPGPYKIELNVQKTEKQKTLTILLRDAAAHLLASIPIKDDTFYRAAADYRRAVQEHKPTIENDNTFGTVLLGQAFKGANPAITFHEIRPSMEEKLHALFHLCAFALD